MLLPTKIRPASPRGSSVPSSSRIFTTVANGGRPAVPGCLAEVLRAGDRGVGDLGRAVDVEQVVAELVHPVGAEVAGQRRAGGRDHLDLRQVVAVERLLRQLHDPLQHHRDHDERVAVLLDERLQAALRVEPAAQHDGRAQQHGQREVSPAPGVEQRRGDVRAPAGPERQPGQQRGGGLDAGLAARGALGRAGRPGGQDDDPALLLRGRVVAGRALARSATRASPGSSRSAPASGGSTQPSTRSRVPASSSIAVNSSSCTTTWGLLPLEHVDELRAGEGGVEVEDVGAELGGRDARVDEAAVVAAHDRDGVTGPDAPRAQRVGEPVAAVVQLPERQLAELVDDARSVRAAGSPSRRSRRRGRSPSARRVAPTRASLSGG